MERQRGTAKQKVCVTYQEEYVILEDNEKQAE
jgi:hypothetical protein